MAEFETRTRVATFEMRDDAATGAPVLEGYAATFNQPYDLGPFREQIAPGAFKRSTNPDSLADVRLLIDHEGQPLARTKSGTLRLSEDSTGLQVRAVLDPQDPDVQRLLPKMRRGDLDQMSFAFRVPTGGDDWADDYTLRTIREANLSGGDVSVVTYPANPHTSVAVRSKDRIEAEYVFFVRCLREIRAGATLSAANKAKLQSILDMISAADDAVDQAQADLAQVIGVANPDDDEAAEPMQANSLSFDYARRIAAGLSL